MTVADGLAFIVTGHGVAAALDAATGDPEWIHFYSRIWGLRESWVDGPPALARGRLLLAPTDASAATLLDARTGTALLSVPPAGEGTWHLRHVLSDGRRFALAGTLDSPVSSDSPLGLVKLLNPEGVSDVSYELPDPPAGRPALAGRTLYVPCRKALYALDLDSGALDVVHVWNDPAEAGDLARLPGWLATVNAGLLRFWKTD